MKKKKKKKKRKDWPGWSRREVVANAKFAANGATGLGALITVLGMFRALICCVGLVTIQSQPNQKIKILCFLMRQKRRFSRLNKSAWKSASMHNGSVCAAA